ncbi:hypothetical protein Tco_0396722 [Tanacetum coccineum]
MEILLEPTSNKLMVGDLCDSIRIKLVTTGKKRWCDSTRIKLVPEHAEYDESNTYVLERFNTTAGNPVKEILLKLNLPDHRSILTDSKEQIKIEIEYMFQDFRYSDTVRPSRSDDVLKLKNFEKDATLQLSSYQIKKGDDDEDDGASRTSTPSPTTYLNSLRPLEYQQYDVPTSFEQNDDLLFERPTDLLNQTQHMHKEIRGGLKSFGKALRRVFGKKNK